MGDNIDEANMPTALIPSEPESPDKAYARAETEERVRAAIASLPWRERKVVGLYYYNEATMKDIGNEIGVNESRVSQLHARAIQRLRAALGTEADPKSAVRIMREAIAAFQQKPKMLKAQLATAPARVVPGAKAPAAPAWTRMPVAMAAERPARAKAVAKRMAAAR
jgi:hypothetical protein